MNSRPWKIVAASGWAIAILSILLIQLGDRTLWNRQPVNLVMEDGRRLSASYYPGSRPAGVMLLEGFGSDQVALRSAASEFTRSGLHVFTFDFPGHARSGGTLAFDNASTDRLARITLLAKERFKQLSGLSDRQIMIAGHSLGARVALQTAVMDPQRVAGLVLFGAQVNLGTNTQAEFFTGASDAELDWVKTLGTSSPPVPVLLISGTWDDILTPDAAQKLLCKLAQVETCQPGTRYGTGDAARESLILPALLHNYEIFSPRALSAGKAWAGDRFGISLETGALAASRRIGLWLAGLGGIFLGLAGSARAAAQSPADLEAVPCIQVRSTRRFLWGKLALWLAALPVIALVSSLYFFLPIGVPVMNLIYVGCIGGYGLLLLLLYRFGRVPGTTGRLPFAVKPGPAALQGLMAALGFSLLVFLITAAYARTGWFYAYPLNQRLAWLAFFLPPTALGFWIGLNEMRMLENSRARSLARLAHTLIGLVPFFLYTFLLAVLGSLSGVVGGLQGLIVLAMVILFGNAIQSLAHRFWLTALLQSILLYFLLLPQGVLFR
jgi:dienelactone hydrolase